MAQIKQKRGDRRMTETRKIQMRYDSGRRSVYLRARPLLHTEPVVIEITVSEAMALGYELMHVLDNVSESDKDKRAAPVE